MALSPRKIGEGLYQPLADINVTPLVDVMLVLLIIFMVTAPMLATGIKVNLPSAKTAQPLENKEPVIVAVAKDGGLSVGRDEVSRDELAAKVKAKLTDSNGVVQLRGDRDAAYGDVVSVMDELAANGVTRIAIVSGPRRTVSPRGAGRAKPSDFSSAKRAVAVTLTTLDGRVFEPPPVRPPWLRPLAIAVVIALHAAALSLVYLTPRPVELPREVIVDIQQEAPPAETPTPPAEQSKPPEQSAPPPAQDAAPAPTEPPPPVPVTPPVAEQPPPPVEQPPLPTPEPPPPVVEQPPSPVEQPSLPTPEAPLLPAVEPPPPVEQPPSVAEQPPLPPPETPPPPPAPVELAPPPPPPKSVEAPRPKLPPPPRVEAAKPQPKPAPKPAPAPRPAPAQSRSAAPAQAARSGSSTSAPSSAAASAVLAFGLYRGGELSHSQPSLLSARRARPRREGGRGRFVLHRPLRRGEFVFYHPLFRGQRPRRRGAFLGAGGSLPAASGRLRPYRDELQLCPPLALGSERSCSAQARAAACRSGTAAAAFADWRGVATSG